MTFGPMHLARGLLVGLVMIAGCATLGAQITQSPSAVPKGQWLMETDVAAFDYSHSRPAGSHVDEGSLSVGAIGVSTGIARGLDIQLAMEAFHQDHSSEDGSDERVSGFGDTTARLRWNFLGDESSGPAFGVMPWVKFPTATGGIGNAKCEWGGIVVFGAPMRGASAFNAMIEMSREWEEDEWKTGWFASMVLVLPLADDWEWYVEAAADWTAGGGSGAAVISGGGLRWELQHGFVLDLEVTAGLSDVAPVVGSAFRFEWEF